MSAVAIGSCYDCKIVIFVNHLSFGIRSRLEKLYRDQFLIQQSWTQEYEISTENDKSVIGTLLQAGIVVVDCM